MQYDDELAALIDQASRNLDTLALLVSDARQADAAAVEQLRERLRVLKADYTAETDALTRHVLQHAVERRHLPERRHTMPSGAGADPTTPS